jgi:hypothetical protein
LILLALLGRAEAAPVEISAERIWLEEGWLRGEGRVHFEGQGRALEAASFAYELASQRLEVREGSWQSPQGPVTFDRASIALSEAGLPLELEAVALHGGEVRIEGERLRWQEGQGLIVEQALLERCTCSPAPWRLGAEELRVAPDGEEAELRGAWVELCEALTLPLPRARLPLVPRKSGLLPPRFSWDGEGPRLAQPLLWVPGPAADLSLAPWAHLRRGVGAELDLRYALIERQGGAARATGGWDLQEQELRGALESTQALQQGRLRAGHALSLSSDAAWRQDYSLDYLERLSPDGHVAAALGAGPVELGLLGTQTFGAAPFGPASLLLSPLPLERGPWSAAAAIGLLGLWSGEQFLPSPMALGELGLSLPLGPAELHSTLSGAGAAAQGLPEGAAQLGADLLLPLWGDLGPWRHVAEPGLRAQLQQAGASSSFEAGPLLRSAWLSPRGLPLRAELALPIDRSGAQPQGRALLQQGGWSAQAQADQQIQELRAGWLLSDQQAQLALIAAPEVEVLLGGWSLGWPLPGLPAWRPAWTGQAEIVDPRLLWQNWGLRFHPNCQCLRIDAALRRAVDEPGLAFALQLELR